METQAIGISATSVWSNARPHAPGHTSTPSDGGLRSWAREERCAHAKAG